MHTKLIVCGLFQEYKLHESQGSLIYPKCLEECLAALYYLIYVYSGWMNEWRMNKWTHIPVGSWFPITNWVKWELAGNNSFPEYKTPFEPCRSKRAPCFPPVPSEMECRFCSLKKRKKFIAFYRTWGQAKSSCCRMPAFWCCIPPLISFEGLGKSMSLTGIHQNKLQLICFPASKINNNKII